ncbi:sulfite exporter TauE/SafE family protein [Sulfitobacter aestuarii]|uniref:Probable membrane transporter protein n=1 Tax=Sulfitobacter aestuarii TaxID=2161676 RepID=A0ABW5TY31_9RHOB
MNAIFALLTPAEFTAALLIAVCAGFVKGVVGFAMPLVLISGLTSFVAPELALAGLILPTVVANLIQALRQGPGAAWASIKLFRAFLCAGFVTLVLSAQLVRVIPDRALLLAISIPVIFFVGLQLSGSRFHLKGRSQRLELSIGAFAGAIGGMSGIWGPPTVAYLTALGTAKQDQMRIQGVIYGLGALTLLGAHVGSGILRAETLPFSAALVLPGAIGMWMGGKISDRIDQHIFRRATLVVLLLVALNLLRRAIMQ